MSLAPEAKKGPAISADKELAVETRGDRLVITFLTTDPLTWDRWECQLLLPPKAVSKLKNALLMDQNLWDSN